MGKEQTHYMPVEALGITEELSQQLETALLRSEARKGEWEHFTPEFIGTQVQSMDINDALRQIYDGQKLFQEARISQPESTIKINSDLPVSIVFFGDWHMGSIYSDHKEILRKVQKVIETPNTYVIFMGNLIDNAIPAKYPNNMLVNAIPPDKQVIMMRQIAMKLNEHDKVLGAVTNPCHEGWTFSAVGQDINALIFGFPERKFPVLENGGRLNIHLPKAKYLGAIYHQVGPYESNFNETHALRQLNRLQLRMEADFVAGGHKHVAAADEVYEGTGKHRKLVAYIRTGSEKGTGEIYDQWAIGKYGQTGEPSGQVLHLFPFKKGVACEVDFDIGMLAHESLYLQAMVQRERAGKI